MFDKIISYYNLNLKMTLSIKSKQLIYYWNLDIIIQS